MPLASFTTVTSCDCAVSVAEASVQIITSSLFHGVNVF